LTKTVLVVATHPDDEVLGCGGSIARHVAEGDVVHVLFMSDGVYSRGECHLDELHQRNQACDEAQCILGVTDWQALAFPDNRMDSVPLLDVVQSLEPIIQQIQPTLVYTHHHGDLNVDHRVTHQAVMTACRPQPGASVMGIYSFEVLSSTGWGAPNVELAFVPNVFVDVASVWEQKLAALRCYEQEMRDFPHARSFEAVDALAKYRGITVGVEVAEAFQLERMISPVRSDARSCY